ncbi:ras-related protein Rab-23 isoform X1 [Eurytemora carolleeae]|uniref:ras-related protein Rab-23 isoform X1 n=2 Tax=Eurytemora carolleeae TaxID=1294199 RepID=UPI000C7732D2|nr:ras-related protein Rab-23 isoform X1 [Eurytemora carolleeae]|eukprot:XP_023349643.1 ras-related protein Rab-23-like isoform X1 [Eurytemora affinis]
MYITDIHDDDFEIAIKIVIVGNGAVGKSSMIQKYCRGIFTSEYKKTIGVDFLEKRLSIQGEDVRLMLWDTAGQEEFDCITRAYYRGAQACVITFSTTDRDSFYQVRRWKKKVEEECGSIPMVLVQNKMDLLYNSAVDSFEVDRLAKNLGMRLIKTSVKENLNVNKVFQYLADCHLNLLRRNNEEYSLIQIGVGGLTSISQTDFLNKYERNWEQERRKRWKKDKRDELLHLCDTRAFFLSPHKSKNQHQTKPNITNLCKLL